MRLWGRGAVSSDGMAPIWTVGSSASIIFPCSIKIQKIFMMAYNNVIGLDPVGVPTCLRKQEVGKPNRNAAQPYANDWKIGRLEIKSGRLLPIYKGKGDPMECGSYRGIKLLEHAMKVVERIF